MSTSFTINCVLISSLCLYWWDIGHLSRKMCTEVENKSFTTRLWELPVALAAVDQLSQIYNAVKERNCVTRMACNAGEKTIDMANSATKPIIQAASTCSLSKPIVGTVECAGKFKIFPIR